MLSHNQPPPPAHHRHQHQRCQNTSASLGPGRYRFELRCRRGFAPRARRRIALTRAPGVGAIRRFDIEGQGALDDAERTHLLTHAEISIRSLVVPAGSAHVLVGPCVALARGGLGRVLEEGHDLGRGKGRELGGEGEPAGEVGFEGPLVDVASGVVFADLHHDAAFVCGEEEGGAVEEALEAVCPDIRAVGVVVHLDAH
jgi:hypothetical protein